MKKKQIFISYSSKDKELVDQIVKKLEDLPVVLWRAPESITPGNNYAREIPQAIRESMVFLLMLSRNSQQSIWVEKEIDSAVSERVHIIPLQLDDEPLSDVYRFYLNNVQTLYYMDSPKDALERVRQQIRRVVELQSQEGSASSADNDKKSEKQNYKENRKEMKRKERMRKGNAFRLNKIPVTCEACGSEHLVLTSLGRYTCKKCKFENYDEYSKIRNYLTKVGSASVIQVVKDTGVSRECVEGYLQESVGPSYTEGDTE